MRYGPEMIDHQKKMASENERLRLRVYALEHEIDVHNATIPHLWNRMMIYLRALENIVDGVHGPSVNVALGAIQEGKEVDKPKHLPSLREQREMGVE